MIIAAISDVHSPRNFQEFVRAVDFMKVTPDLFLIAGDMVDRGKIEEYGKIYNVLFGKIKCPVIACFGNNEFDAIRQTAKMKYPDIKFLDDEATMMRIGDKTVGVIGTTGSLDNPTPWQKENIKNIEGIFRERVNLVDRHLQRIQADYKIVLMHYSPTYKTLEGENPRFYASMGSRSYEIVLQNRKPTVVVHGHSLRGNRMAWLDTVPVFNVAFAVSKGITIIDTENLKPGLTQFV